MSEEKDLLRKQIYLTADLNRRLRAAATGRGKTESCLVREALVEYLAAEERRRTPEKDNPVLQMIGMFEGDESCREVSARTEETLREADQK
ncbi:MAG: hypothetical protein ACM3ZC_04460 [Bacteroidota bacterium]